MTPQDFLQKIQDGSLNEVDAKELVRTLQSQLEAMKQSDPAKYLEVVKSLNAALGVLGGNE